MSAFVLFVFLYFVGFSVLHAGLLGAAAFETRRYARTLLGSSVRRTVRSPLAPPVSVLVPAFNESAGIVDSVRSLLALEYPTFELVVVNDGSSDDTLAVLIEEFDLRPALRPLPPFLEHAAVRGVYAPKGRLPLLVIDKENAGKADALNAGINYAAYPLVCAIDADSILEQDALVKTVMPFVDDPVRTVVSGGMVRVANGCRIERGRVAEPGLPRNALAMFQVVEYIRSFFGARTGWSAINGLLIVSGAFGLFRKDMVIAAGGYRTDIVGEDIELVVRLHRRLRDEGRPYRIVYVPDPVCWTEAPESTRILRRQRRRWHRGSVETLLIHRGMIGNPRYRAVGLLALPALLFFEVLGPAIEIAGYLVAVTALLLGQIDLTLFCLFLAVAILYGLFLSIGSIALEDATFGRHAAWDDLGRVLAFAVLENLGYRQLVLLWRIEGFWQLIRKGDWGAMERKGLSIPSLPPIESEVELR
jgi:cellulose synthase/poly-beta-1,6-N-acetylglucosamine synthase-like glycosyltransferase